MAYRRSSEPLSMYVRQSPATGDASINPYIHPERNPLKSPYSPITSFTTGQTKPLGY
jgi:hypothetical protein